MAENEDGQEKNFAPTARRLERARDEGQVALSREVPVLAGLGVGVAVMMTGGPALSRGLAQRLDGLFAAAGTWDPARQGVGAAFHAAGLAWLYATAPIALAVVTASLAAVILQTGVLFRPAGLQPDFTRLNPLSGLKRLFGLDHAVEAAKSIAKIAVMVFAAWGAISRELISLPGSSSWTTATLLTRVMADIEHLMLVMLAAQTMIALLDVVWVRMRHNTRLRMTREDVRQESKETEGNPEVKQRLRRVRQARARKRMMAAVPKAAVVVTNPTHYAVALAYERGQKDAPKVVAKGVDALAERIRDMAREHRIPVVANPPLARALFLVEVDREVPREHFQAVAEIIAYVWRVHGRMAALRGPPVR